jgi:immune inhibitor A
MNNKNKFDFRRIIKPHSFHSRCMMPPSPGVIASLKSEFDRSGETDIEKFLHSVGLEPGYNPLGKDDPVRPDIASLERGILKLEKIDVPSFRPRGEINSLVILIDFEDNVAKTDSSHYEELLFSTGTYLTGSLRDYYNVVSNGRVDITGQVSGWHRMSESYSYYVGKDSGGDMNGYPNNARRMVEEAVTLALEKDRAINWNKYDLNADKTIDALFVVHAGPGAEVQQTEEGRKKHIWSHKWVVQNPVKVSDNTWASIYMTVPEDGLLGVYAHEAGHLIFGWPDLYDACTDQNRTAGVGNWSLMASGSWANGGVTPTYPDAWCRMVQQWPSVTRIRGSKELSLKPIVEEDVVVMIPIRGKLKEYFIIEHRKRSKFDQYLPGDGLLVYHIDEGAENNCDENHLAVGVIQADGQQDLERIGLFGNQGDDGDPFPGAANRTSLDSTNFPNTLDYDGNKTGISLNNIRVVENNLEFEVNME